MLFVYGALTRPTRVKPADTLARRAEVIEKASNEAMNEQEKWRIEFGLWNSKGTRARKIHRVAKITGRCASLGSQDHKKNCGRDHIFSAQLKGIML